MKKLGVTSTGSFLVELTPDEFETLKANTTPTPALSAPARMTIAERVAFAAPRLRKLKAGTMAAVTNSIAVMFKFHGGISDPDIRKVVDGLKKAGELKIDSAGRVTYAR